MTTPSLAHECKPPGHRPEAALAGTESGELRANGQADAGAENVADAWGQGVAGSFTRESRESSGRRSSAILFRPRSGPRRGCVWPWPPEPCAQVRILLGAPRDHQRKLVLTRRDAVRAAFLAPPPSATVSRHPPDSAPVWPPDGQCP